MKEKRIAFFSYCGLGLERDGRVRLAPYEPLWMSAFEKESEEILGALRLPELTIHHVGSTSIPGIHAKPILDLLLELPSLTVLDERQAALESLGYSCKGEYGIPGRRYSVLYDMEEAKGFVHVHAFARGHGEIEKHLVFRDFLRAQPAQAKRYEATKMKLAGDPAIGRANYTEEKAPLIQELMQMAQEWRKKETGVLANSGHS